MIGRNGAAVHGPGGERRARHRPRLRGAARATAVAVLLMAAPALAQTPASGETPPAENAAGALSPESLARIRAALQADRRAEGSARTVFSDPDGGWIIPPRPPVELAPGLGFIEGLGLFDDLTRGSETALLGGPSHWDMMNQMQPREVTEVALADGMAIGTVSAFAVGLPYFIRKVHGWLSGPGSGAAPPAQPVLTSTQEAAALEDMRAQVGVIDAGLRQRGRTVALSLVVPAGTEPRLAREIGERFVRLVGRRAAGGPDAFDYVVSVRSPDALIASGGKPTTDPLVRW